MTTDELWTFHQTVVVALVAKLTAEKKALEDRLRQLRPTFWVEQIVENRPSRRPCPTVLPKYQNLDDPSETWSGRGRQPRWLTAQLGSGKHIDDFRIGPPDGLGSKIGSSKAAPGFCSLNLLA
jgi:DNA-binding protein H-NS